MPDKATIGEHQRHLNIVEELQGKLLLAGGRPETPIPVMPDDLRVLVALAHGALSVLAVRANTFNKLS